jgi:hypothetical protein
VLVNQKILLIQAVVYNPAIGMVHAHAQNDAVNKKVEVTKWEFSHDFEISSAPISMPCLIKQKIRKN